ncbi:MAG TPA: hypothetical protein VGK78_06550 [Nocardioides sp.]|uniref:hypothetical protein n=1 Tax=Nocardioides sp. TaxID=35761 RepID=UPI002F41C1CF
MRSIRRTRPPVEVEAGERLLAWAPLEDGGWVAGTRDALYFPGGRVPWEQVEAADWDRDEARLRVSEVGTWGEQRPRHVFHIPDSAARDTDRLLQLVRERVTASVLVSRHVPVTGRRGVRVVARRAPSGRSEVQWVYEYDEGVDPDDPFVRAAAETALAAARSDVGML